MEPCIFQPKLEKIKIIRPEKISYISGKGKPEMISFIFSKESCFYISGNGNPEKVLYNSGNVTFLYFMKGMFRTLT